jgi:hypothetical protein
MSSWREKEWKLPRKGEVVKDPDGNLGWVLRSEGTLTKRILWIEDVKGCEIYSGEPAEMFECVENQIASDFHKERYSLKGFRIGALCSYRGDRDVPLEILQMDWSFLRDKMIFCLKDLRNFRGEVMKTENDSNLVIFDENYPSLQEIVSSEDTGLKYRIDVFLAEKDSQGWTNTGSPWEFHDKESALKEVESWRSRLLVRRVSSVLSSHWKVSFPCWTVEAILEEGEFLTRVKRVEALSGAPGYFETASHASLAMKLVPPQDWFRSYFFSHDGPIA